MSEFGNYLNHLLVKIKKADSMGEAQAILGDLILMRDTYKAAAANPAKSWKVVYEGESKTLQQAPPPEFGTIEEQKYDILKKVVKHAQKMMK
jgi:hypothetical protein